MTTQSERSVSLWPNLVTTTVTFVVGAFSLSRSSVWTDEAATWATSRMPISAIFRFTIHTQDAVFLPYYLFMHLWLGVSQHAWSMRLPSLVAAAATTWALTSLVRRWISPAWALLAGFLLALNPLFVRWAIEARPYSLATFFAVVSTGALLTAIERGGRRNWFAYGVLSLCMMLFHPLAIFVLVAHVVTVVATNRRSAWFGQAVVLGGVLVLIGPLALVAVGQRAQVSWIPSPRPTTFFTALTDVSGGRIPAIGLVICSLIVLLAAIRATAHSDERFLTTLVLSWALLPSLAMVAVSFLHPIYVDRYALVSVPGVAIVVTMAARHIWNLLLAHSGASGSASTPEASARFAPRTVSTRTASSSPVGVVLVVAFGIAPLWLAHKSWGVVRQPYYIDDYRTASAVFQADLHGDDVTILVVKADAGRGFAFYAWSRRLREELLHPAALSLPTVVHRPSSVPARLTQRGIIWSQDAPSACSGVVGIGWDSTPNLRFDIEGRTCELGNVRHFGLVWVANSEAV